MELSSNFQPYTLAIHCSVYIGETVKSTVRRSLSIATILGVVASFILVITPVQLASAAFRPVSSGGLSITSIANQQVMTDPVTGARNYMAGMAGDLLTFIGSGFSTGTPEVTFLGQNSPTTDVIGVSPTVISDTEMTVVVPVGATTGLIKLTDSANTVTSADEFQIWSGRSEPYVMPDGHLNITIGDLKFILDQIKFSEAFANRTATSAATLQAAPSTTVVSPYDVNSCMNGTDFVSARNLQQYGATGLSNTYIYDSISPWGLRQVDGRCNNIVAAADGTYTNKDWGATDTLFSRIEPATPSANGLYSANGSSVTDNSPREISNLISDQTDKNPAAVSAAQDTAAILGTDVTYSNTVNATTGVITQVLDIPNVTADYNTSAGYNSWFTLFGQFFDHGLDLIPKGDPAYVLIPLERTDPLYSTNPADPNFMILTRGVITGGANAGESMNITTPYIDQSQSYGSHPSQNFFLREYSFAAETGIPTSTGRLLDGTDGSYTFVTSGIPALNADYTATTAPVSLPTAWVTDGARNYHAGTLGTSNGGLPTWRDVKAQSLLLGFRLTDYDASNIPVVATDQFGSFIPCTNGFPMMLFKSGANYRWICGDPANPVATSTTLSGVVWKSVNTNHNFINDTANNAVPYSGSTMLSADADLIVNTAKAAGMVHGYYDNESLDAHYVAGDGRVNENIGLAAVHGVFHSEHNLLLKDIEDLLVKNPQVSKEFFSEWNLTGGTPNSPKWNGIRLYQAARFIMEMEYQHMTFDEFIRRISPSLQVFAGYNQATNPAITAEFASSVYRLGHSMLNETIARSVPGTYYDSTANEDLSLIDAFTSPIAFRMQKPITVTAGHIDSDHTITYTVQTSTGTVSPTDGQVVSISGFEASSGLNVVNAVVSSHTSSSFTVNASYPGGATANPVPFSGLTVASEIVGRRADDRTFVTLATINDPNGQFSYSPASATAAIVQGMTAQRGNEIDEFVTDAVRNNLLGLPLDLAALNISRGRDTLLPTLNKFRDELRSQNKAPVAAYPSWLAYGNKMRHFDSLANFIAAYGTHPSITTHRITRATGVTTTATSITYTTSDSLTGNIHVGDVVSISGLTSQFNKSWAVVSEVAVDGSTFTVNGTYTADPAEPYAGLTPPLPTQFAGLTVETYSAPNSASYGYVTRDTTTAERRAAAQLLVPSDVKSAVMNVTTAGDPATTTTKITYDAVNAFSIGDRVTVQGVMPLVFNQTATVVAPTTSTSFTVALDTNPAKGTYFMGGRATLTTPLSLTNPLQVDAEAFINSQAPPAGDTVCDYPAGPRACIDWAHVESGMNYVDLWIGGLAEAPVTQPISPEMLPATFDYVFTTQMLNLMNGDRLYYLSRLIGTNMGDEIQGQKFANIIIRNTPDKAGNLPNNAVSPALNNGGLKATPDFIFGIGDCTIDGSTYTPANPGCPNTFLDSTTGTITHTPVVLNTVMVNDETCIAGQTSADGMHHKLQAGGGDDVVWGGRCKDFLRGGIGGDMIVGLGGDDVIFGEGGDDVMQGGAGNDFIDAGDNVVGDIADGGSGKDFISAGAGMGVFAFAGEAGDDFMVDGATAPAPYNGGDGNDWVQDGNFGGALALSTGDSGPNAALNNTLDGGSDVIMGGGGNDINDGGSGNDVFLSGDGADSNLGSEGFDIVSYEYRNLNQSIFADLSGALAVPLTIFPDVYVGVEGLSGSSGNDLLSSDTAPDLTIPNATGTIGSDLIYVPANNIAVRANQQISGLGIPAHSFVIAPPALVPNIATPTYSITISNMLTASFGPGQAIPAQSIQIHGWSLASPDYITGLTPLISVAPGWNKPVQNVNVTSYTTTVGTSTGDYLMLDRAIDWITEGSTVSFAGVQLVDANGAAITVTGVNAYAISLSALPANLPSLPALATFTPVNTFSGGNIILGGAGHDIIYSQGGDNVIDGEAYLHTCIAATLADGVTEFNTGWDVNCGTGKGYSNLNVLNNIAGVGTVNPVNMNIVREIKMPDAPTGGYVCPAPASILSSTTTACNTLIYSGTQSQYTVTPMVTPSGDIQYFQIIKPDGVDIVRNISRIQFGNPVINTQNAISDLWNSVVCVGASCLNLVSNYAPLSSSCLSICPAANVNSFAPPTIATVTPAGGAPGTVVTITGTNFRTAMGTTTVTIGGIAGAVGAVTCTNVNVIDTLTLTCVVPSNFTTTGNVYVNTIGGSSTQTSAFTFVPLPTITKLSVATGTSGTAVTITGTNLTYLVNVDINGAAAIIRTKTATTIGITVPNNASTGLVHVITSSGTATFATPFVVKPTITSFSPTSGAVGSAVTITGNNLSGVTGVKFNNVSATSITVVSPTSISVIVPNTISGKVALFTPAAATAAATSTGNFTVTPKPTITALTSSVVFSNTATATITGTSLTGAYLFKIGNVVAPIATSPAASATSLTFKIPTGVPFNTAQTVSVTTPGGTTVTTSLKLTVTPPVTTITAVSPASGQAQTTVQIVGTNFINVSAVKFGGSAGVSAAYKVINDKLIIADIPVGLSSTTPNNVYNIYVAVPNALNGGVTSSNTLRVTRIAGTDSTTPAAATLTATSYPLGASQVASGVPGNPVTLSAPTSTQLGSLAAVRFNGVNAPFTLVTQASPSFAVGTILTSVPAGATTGKIQLVYPGGTIVNGPDFTVTSSTGVAPSITSFAPLQASVGATITVTGTNLAGTLSATLNGVSVSTLKVISPTSISFIVPAGATTGSLIVVATGGNSASQATPPVLSIL